jgi:hypothetical protein
MIVLLIRWTCCALQTGMVSAATAGKHMYDNLYVIYRMRECRTSLGNKAHACSAHAMRMLSKSTSCTQQQARQPERPGIQICS